MSQEGNIAVVLSTRNSFPARFRDQTDHANPTSLARQTSGTAVPRSTHAIPMQYPTRTRTTVLPYPRGAPTDRRTERLTSDDYDGAKHRSESFAVRLVSAARVRDPIYA